MKEITEKANYEMAEITGVDEYKFKRKFCDFKYGRNIDELIVVKKTVKGGWNFSIEDRVTKTKWKIFSRANKSGSEIVFKRHSKTRDGIKTEIFNLAYLPTWIMEEIKLVAAEMEKRKMDEDGKNFLLDLATNIEQEKVKAKAGLSAKIEELSIGGLYYILSETRGDARGSFREVARFPEIEILSGYDFVGKQVNHSMSTYGILRGLHVEPWAKLVTVISGLAVAVLLDCRLQSKTFGKTETVFLGYGTTPDGNEIKGGALFIEPGIANSVFVLSEVMNYQYVVDDLWRPDTALYSVNPMDSALGIDWGKYVPVDKIIRSDRDKNSPTFAEFTEKMRG